MTTKKTFSIDKSHLSAFQLAKFKTKSTLDSPVIDIPGVGEVTFNHFKSKNIHTISDVVNTIGSYEDLIKLLPKYVNSHRIYHALLDTFPDYILKANNEKKPTTATVAIVGIEEELKNVGDCNMQ
tara:strand:- start:9784 stop:10158 length:375 start_codon:yes stop_codon:yes gene_type:complete